MNDCYLGSGYNILKSLGLFSNVCYNKYMAYNSCETLNLIFKKTKQMKTLFVLLFALTSMATSENIQETETTKTTFTEYADGIYYFTDADDYSIEFEHIKKEVLAKYDLSTDAFKGKLFVITYETDTETDEEGDDISTAIIVDLKLVE